MNRTVVETMVRMALTDMKRSPERSLRNLVDLGVSFAGGRFQSNLMKTMQTMLQDKSSPYYALLKDVIVHVDTERLVRFGVNLGYNSFNYGAQRIRSVEATQGFNVPWSVFLDVGDNDSPARKLQYRNVLSQGVELGIYTWQLFSRGKLAFLLDLAAMFPECAFIVYCAPQEVTEDLIQRASELPHVVLAVEYRKGTKGVCQMLRDKSMLYAIYATYKEKDVDAMATGKFLKQAQSLHPGVTILYAQKECSETARKRMYDTLLEHRKSRCFGTVPWDGVYDTCFVDTVISDDMCSAGFDEHGWLFTEYKPEPLKQYDLFHQPLKNIFGQAFPKEENTRKAV